jgi:hypothetical protein
LLALGVLGIISEIKTGAFGIGALLGLLSFSLFFGASYVSGLAGWHEVGGGAPHRRGGSAQR